MSSISLQFEESSSAATPLLIRKAQMRDIDRLLKLINGYAGEGLMLPRTEFEISENIRDFTIVHAEGRLVACGALHFYTPTSGEIRSLAVDSTLKMHGLGRLVVESLEHEAEENSLHAVFAFTYVPGFFRKMGFRTVDRGELPLKVWKDCLRCSKFQCCDEIAVLKALRPDPVLQLKEVPVPDEFDVPLSSIELPHVKVS